MWSSELHTFKEYKDILIYFELGLSWDYSNPESISNCKTRTVDNDRANSCLSQYQALGIMTAGTSTPAHRQ